MLLCTLLIWILLEVNVVLNTEGAHDHLWVFLSLFIIGTLKLWLEQKREAQFSSQCRGFYTTIQSGNTHTPTRTHNLFSSTFLFCNSKPDRQGARRSLIYLLGRHVIGKWHHCQFFSFFRMPCSGNLAIFFQSHTLRMVDKQADMLFKVTGRNQDRAHWTPTYVSSYHA